VITDQTFAGAFQIEFNHPPERRAVLGQVLEDFTPAFKNRIIAAPYSRKLGGIQSRTPSGNYFRNQLHEVRLCQGLVISLISSELIEWKQHVCPKKGGQM
jgi:hypothetical protein